MMERSACLTFTGSWNFSPVTSKYSLVYLKNVEGGCYTRHVCYICAIQIFRRQKTRWHFFLACLNKFLIWTVLFLPHLPGHIEWYRQKNVKLAVYPAHVIHMCQKILLRWDSNCTVCLLIDWWASQTEMLHHFHNNKTWWFWVFWTTFRRVMTIDGVFCCHFWPIKCKMARTSFSSGQNKDMRPLFNSNRGLVIINKRFQNFILTTRIVKNGCWCVFRPKKRINTHFYYSSGQNLILWPFIGNNYTPISIKM